MSKRTASWAGVEFQPNLKNAQIPVRLGLVLCEPDGSGESGVIVMGRMPLVDNRPEEFAHASDLTMAIATQWVQLIGKEVIEYKGADVLSELASRWRWNLYLIKPKRVASAEQKGLMPLAKQLYKDFVGEPFEAAPKRRRPVRRPTVPRTAAPAQIEVTADILPAWMLHEITDRSLMVHR